MPRVGEAAAPAAAFSRPASPAAAGQATGPLAAPLLEQPSNAAAPGGAGSDEVVVNVANEQPEDEHFVFRILQGIVLVVGMGASSIKVPLYYAESSDDMQEVPGRSPCYLEFWRRFVCRRRTASSVGEDEKHPAPEMHTTFAWCVWWLLRGVLVVWPCAVDVYFLVRVGGIVPGGSPKDYPGVPAHAWQTDEKTREPIPGGIVPDTGGNFLSLPVHLLGVGALWFVGNSRTQIIWHRLLRSRTPAKVLPFGLLLFLVALSITINFLRYTHYHVWMWSSTDTYMGGNPIWWTPEMSLNFKEGRPLPPLDVVISIASELTCIATFAASAMIFATIYHRTAETKLRFMELLEDHVALNHRRQHVASIAAQDDAAERSSFDRETISAPIQQKRNRGTPTPIHAQQPLTLAAVTAGGISRVPSTGVDDFVPDSIRLVRTVSAVRSAELAERTCLPATELEDHFLRVVRAVGTMDVLLNRVLSYFAVCLVTAGFCTTYVYNIRWDRDMMHHQYRITLLLLLLPQIMLPVYCVLVGARANSLDKFKRAICDADARGAFAHLAMSERANLLLRMTATHMPQIAAFGVPITPKNVYAMAAVAGVLNTAFAQRERAGGSASL